MENKACVDIHIQTLIGTELMHLWHQIAAPGLLGYDATVFAQHTGDILLFFSADPLKLAQIERGGPWYAAVYVSWV